MLGISAVPRPLGNRPALLGSRVLDRAEAVWKASRYDSSGVLRDLSGNGHDAQLGSTSGADSNDPLWLEYAGTPYLYLPGVDGNGATGPTIALTNGIDYEIDVELNDWTPAATNTFTNHRGATLIWRAYVSTSGIVSFAVYDSGGAAKAVHWTPAVGITGRQQFRLRCDPSAGSLTIERWVDGAWSTEESATVAAFALPAGTAPLTIGSNNSSHTGEITTGKIYRATLRDGIDGTLVADFDPSRSAEPHTSFSASTGETWTINRSSSGRKSVLVDRTVMLLGVDDYLEVPDAPGLDFGAGEDFTILAAIRKYGTQSSAYSLVTKRILTGADTGWSLLVPSLSRVVRFNTATPTDAEDNGPSLTDGILTVAAGRRSGSNVEAFLDDTSNGSTAGSDATLANARSVVIGAAPGGTNFGDYEWRSAAIFRSALTDAEIARAGRELLSR